MTLADADRELVVEELGREPTPEEAALFENLWSEHCAYRSSRPLLSAFDSDGDQVVIGPGDDAAVVALPSVDTDAEPGHEDEETYITLGIESHNHPSYVDPYDGAATGVGGIVRDTLSMGAYPIALADCLYFGNFAREHSQYLFEGVVEGISDYGNAIGVPTVAGSVTFHPDYVGNPLVNVACVGLLSADRLVTAVAQTPGNKLVLVGSGTGRDGLGGASFASEDLDEESETEDRPAVQVGDPYTEKLLIEANEELLDADLIVSARDLGAAGLGGASSELVAKGGLGAQIELETVHQREPNMNALEILLAESQERMCYEVRPEDVEQVSEIAEKFDLGCSVIGDVTDTGRYVATFDGETVVDAPAEFIGEGAPMNDLDRTSPPEPERDLPEVDLQEAFEAVVSSPNTASKEWVYRQYDHEVGARTAMKPGDDAAIVAIREAGLGLAIAASANPLWTACDPYEGARAVALENATDLAAKGATPLAAVDCLNGGNPEKPAVYDGFANTVDGLADMCSTLDVPVVGGNVSLYNDSPSGPIPPTPTIAMVGTKAGYDAPTLELTGEGDLLVVGDSVLDGDEAQFGGSEYLAQFGGTDAFPALCDHPEAFIASIQAVASLDSTRAVHDVGHGGLAVTLSEMVTENAGATVELPDAEALFHELPGRVVVESTDTDAVRTAIETVSDEHGLSPSAVAPVHEVGTATESGSLSLSVGEGELRYGAGEIAERRDVITRELD